MHKVALYNGKSIEAAKLEVCGLSDAAMYGRGVFTTIAIHDGRPFLADRHWRRLIANAQAIGLELSGLDHNKLDRSLDKILDANSVLTGRARVDLIESGGSGLWTSRTRRTDVVMVTADRRDVAARPRLTISPYAINSRSPLAGVKSCNYLENLLAMDEARDRGFDEAIRLNEMGEITSACMANVFWLTNGQVTTPKLETGCLAGTTREFIMENLECREVCIDISELRNADSVFICSAGIGIREAACLDDVSFKVSGHEILSLDPGQK